MVSGVEIVKEVITTQFDTVISKINDNPKIDHPILSREKGYLPIRKSARWPQDCGYYYLWTICFERNRTATSTEVGARFFPDPQEFVKKRQTELAEIKLRNPTLRTDQSIFTLITPIHSGQYATNSIEEVVQKFFQTIDAYFKTKPQKPYILPYNNKYPSY